MSLIGMKQCAALGCTNSFFIGDSHLDCINHWDCKKTGAWNNLDRVPCTYVLWELEPPPISGGVKAMNCKGSAAEVASIPQVVVFAATDPSVFFPNGDCFLPSLFAIFPTIGGQAVFLTNVLPDTGGCPRPPPAPAAASSLVAPVTPPASSGPIDHATLGQLVDPNAPCPKQADKLDQILAPADGTDDPAGSSHL